MSSIDRLAAPRRHKVFNRKLLPSGDNLPFWSTMSLDSKIPVAPSPRGSYTLFTTELGQPKYVSKQKYDFDLTDPYGNATPAEYDSLQDPYLKTFFRKPDTKRHLVGNGLLTGDEKIVCSVKEFNEYREYLRHRSVTDFNLKRRRRLEREAERRNSRKAKSEYNVNEREEELKESLLKARLDMYSRSNSLVTKLKRRESLLSMRMEEKRFQQMMDTERRIKESWEDRKKRQQQMLERENDIEQKDLNRRREQLEERERTLAKQRERQLAKLDKIKKDFLRGRERKFGKMSHSNSLDRSYHSQKGTESITGESTNQEEARHNLTSTPDEKTKSGQVTKKGNKDDKTKQSDDDKEDAPGTRDE